MQPMERGGNEEIEPRLCQTPDWRTTDTDAMLTTRFGRASFVAANRCIRLNHTAAKPTIGFIGLGNMVRKIFFP